MTYELLASQQFARASIYLNMEKLTNVRRMRFDPMPRPVPGDGGRPTPDAWAPLDGHSTGAGVEVRP
jgi:hypothetical protein